MGMAGEMMVRDERHRLDSSNGRPVLLDLVNTGDHVYLCCHALSDQRYSIAEADKGSCEKRHLS